MGLRKLCSNSRWWKLDGEREGEIAEGGKYRGYKDMGGNNTLSMDKIVEALNNVVNAFKDYYLKGRRLLTLSAFTLIALIFCVIAFLTYIGRVGGETFAFVAGTIVGYIISILAGQK